MSRQTEGEAAGARRAGGRQRRGRGGRGGLPGGCSGARAGSGPARPGAGWRSRCCTCSGGPATRCPTSASFSCTATCPATYCGSPARRSTWPRSRAWSRRPTAGSRWCRGRCGPRSPRRTRAAVLVSDQFLQVSPGRRFQGFHQAAAARAMLDEIMYGAYVGRHDPSTDLVAVRRDRDGAARRVAGPPRSGRRVRQRHPAADHVRADGGQLPLHRPGRRSRRATSAAART